LKFAKYGNFNSLPMDAMHASDTTHEHYVCGVNTIWCQNHCPLDILFGRYIMMAIIIFSYRC